MYTFRSECLQDVLRFLGKVGEKSVIMSCQLQQDPVLPDVDVILEVDLSLLSLHQIAALIPDAHVIEESLELKRS